MVRSVLEASKCDDNPLTKVARAMEWNIELTGKDIENLEIYDELMERFAIHTDRLGADKTSTIQMFKPTTDCFGCTATHLQNS